MKKRNIAIFGYNLFSFELASRLHDDKDHEIIILDSAPDKVSQALEQGFKAAIVDYRSDESLEQIGIGRNIDIIFCCLPEDGENVFLTITARAMNSRLEIISIVDAPDSANKLITAGANKIINPYEISARKIFSMVTRPKLTLMMDEIVFGRADLHIAEIEIPRGSKLANTRASDLHLDTQHNLILLGIVDYELGEELHFALGEQEHQLDPGDVLLVMGPSREIRAFSKEISETVEKH